MCATQLAEDFPNFPEMTFLFAHIYIILLHVAIYHT